MRLSIFRLNRKVGNKYNGCFNDNFLSLYELYDAFNGEGDYIDVLEIIKED